MRAAAVATFALWLFAGGTVHAEVLIRWDQQQIPSSVSLGISTVVVPAANAVAVRSALEQGYRVYLEIDAAALPGFVGAENAIAGVVVKGHASPQQLALLKGRLPRGARVIILDDRAKWPHIRSNSVTRSNDVLQVGSRSAQPWVENNTALLRIVQGTWISYSWQPVTLSETDNGPEVENYLVAIAEAGLFGGDLLLPLHERFEQDLLLGLPRVRAEWERIRRHIQFYASDLPRRYQPIANIGVVTADATPRFEILNLLARHNLPFELIAPARLSASAFAGLDLVIVLDPPTTAQLDLLAAFASKGGTVVLDATPVAGNPASARASARPWRDLTPVLTSDDRVSYRVGEGRVVEVLKGIPDPNRFALEIRQILGPEHRVLDIWNGITVITAGYKDPGGRSVLVSVLNYAHQPLPVQLRIAGTFSLVQYESPDEQPVLLSYEHRGGYTEVVLPALTIGGRLFLH